MITSPHSRPSKAKAKAKPHGEHPWVAQPAVAPAEEGHGLITRPLPVHLQTPAQAPAKAATGAVYLSPDDLAALALPAAPEDPASYQPAVDDSAGSGQAILDDSSPSEKPHDSVNHRAILGRSSSPEIQDTSANPYGWLNGSPLPGDSHEDEPLGQPKITPAAISSCGGTGACGGHCANHAKASQAEEDAIMATRRLNQALNEQVGELKDALSQTQGALAEALSDLAFFKRDRDLRLTREDPAAPFRLTAVPANWFGELRLKLSDDDTGIRLNVSSEGAGAYCDLKAKGTVDAGDADFLPGLISGLIHLMDHLFPHLAAPADLAPRSQGSPGLPIIASGAMEPQP